VSGKDATWLVSHGDASVVAPVIKRIGVIVKKRLRGEPLYYILGRCEFCGLSIVVDKNVLIPRPETEMLVKEAISTLSLRGAEATKQSESIRWDCHAPTVARNDNNRGPIRILDVGTGSGAIAVAIGDYCLRNNVDVKIIASDISKKALNAARKNIRKYQLENIVDLQHSDLLSGIDEEFNIITANLPYVETDKIDGLPDPGLALDGGKDGFDLVAKLLHQICDKKTLTSGGVALFEIGHNQEQLFKNTAISLFPNAEIITIKDLGGYPRIGKILFRY